MALGISKSIFRNSPSELGEWLVFGTYKAFKQIDQRFAPNKPSTTRRDGELILEPGKPFRVERLDQPAD
jgi:hypothetical protein